MQLNPDIWSLNPEDLDLRALKREADSKGFPRPWHILVFNTLVALALDVWAFFGGAMPGVSTRLLLSHLREDGTPATSNILWGYLVRMGEYVPGVTITQWTAGLSAAFGVLCVAVLTALLLHKGYWVVEKSSPQAVARESWGRRLAGLSGGLFLAVSAPWWVASTRAFPMTFHVLLLLAVFCLYEAYRKTGRRWWLCAFLFLWGVYATQTDTGWYLAPVALWMAGREMAHWDHHKSWWTWLLYAASAAAGLSLYVVLARLTASRGSWLGMYPGGAWEAFRMLLRTQFASLAMMKFSPALLVFGCILAVPWCTLFLLSHRCPWCYEGAEIWIRVVFGLGLASIAWTPPYSPCYLVPGGLSDPPVVPSLVLAVCFGCTVGETWLMGDLRERIDNTFWKRLLRRTMTVLALLLVPAAAAGAWRNAPRVKVPGELWTHGAIRNLFEQRGNRSVVLCGAPYDDLVLMEMRESRSPVAVMSYSRASNPQYLKLLARRFAGLGQASLFFSEGNFDAGMRTWLGEEEQLEQTLAIGRPDMFNEYGWMAPVGIAYRIETSPDRIPLDGVLATQRPLWERVAEEAGTEVEPDNPYYPYWMQCNAIVAREANDAAVRAADEGRLPLAEELLALADRIMPENLSVKMNRVRVAEKMGMDEDEIARRREEWETQMWSGGLGTRWVLGAYYGYVWDAHGWMRDGTVWALSGAPLTEAGARRKSALDLAVDGRFEKWLDQAFIAAGQEDVGEVAYRQVLMANPYATRPLLELARLALKDKHPEIAEAYLDEAEARGVKADDIRYERAMVDYSRLLFARWKGKKDGKFPAGKPLGSLKLSSPLKDPDRWCHANGTVRAADEVFRELSRAAVGDMRIWMTLYLLADGAQPESDEIEKLLKAQRMNDPDLWLTLCSVHIQREEWGKAKLELNRAINMDTERIPLWEMTMSIAEHEANAKLLVSAKNRLLRMQPFHFLAQQQMGEELYTKGDLEGAAKVFRLGIFFKRDPVLLNNLAHVLIEMDPTGNYDEALQLVDEAIKRDPGRLGFYGTRAKIHLAHGDSDAALRDVRRALMRKEPGIGDYLLLAEICQARGDVVHAEAALRRAGVVKARPRFSERTRMFALRDWIDAQKKAQAEGKAGE
ncbi:MAG: hypothetical protein IK066_02670 [Kiritimatiellae bacterium]|nr:hypothetical protein [Kiritimatiellia bacterium]